jgi:hypothetical protein
MNPTIDGRPGLDRTLRSPPAMPRSQPLFDFSPLHRPLWWAALVVLLVNDNLLKGGGEAPGWLTGKLSDFAFLIVAPVLLAAMLPRAVSRRRGVALAVVTLVYAAADLSPAVSAAIVAAARWIGLPWRLWPDVTDLLALAVLPLTWRLMRPVGASMPAPMPAQVPAPAPGPRSRPLVEALGVFVGAFACLATSAPPSYAHAPFVVNQTSQPREITATWLLRTIPCDADLAGVAATLNPNDLDDPHRGTLASGDVAVLDAPPPPGQPLSSQCPYDRGYYGYGGGNCTGVIVQISTELSVLASFPLGWREYDGGWVCSGNDNAQSKCKPHFGPKEDPGPDALSLRERDGKLVLSLGVNSQVRIVEVSPATIAARAPSPQGCRTLLAEQAQISNAASSCTTDADCRTAPALPIPGRACVIYGNRSLSEQATSNLRTRWTQQACITGPDDRYNCAPQPAVCRNERCQEACPGVQLPICPGPCGDYNSSGTVCYAGLLCAPGDGSWCTCKDGKLSCAPPTKMPGCSIACVQRVDPYPTPPPSDAGSDAGRADASPEGGTDTQAETGL